MLANLRLCLFIITSVFLSINVQAALFKAGVDYVLVSETQIVSDNNEVLVTEAFGYACPHCNNFEPVLHAWYQKQPKYVKLDRLPVVFSRSWELLARAYYSSQLLNGLDKTHVATYHALHNQRLRLNTQEKIADLYAKQGLDKAKFNSIFNSFILSSKLRQAEDKIQAYGVEGVPTLIVNGKYRVLPGSEAKMLAVVDYLVSLERQPK